MTGIAGERLPQSEARAEERRLKITIVAPSLRYVGGQSVQADLLLRHWSDDPDVEARFLPIDPVFPRGLRWAERVPFLRTLFRQPLYLLTLWRNLAAGDVVHVFSASYWSFLIAPTPALWIARMRGQKTIVHYHSGEARDHLRRFRSARKILRRADRLVVPSEYLIRVFDEFGLKSQAIPNLIDENQFIFRKRVPLRPHLICTRGFHHYYGIDVVVRAFAELKKQFPSACLDLVGKGPLEHEILALLRDLNLSGVRFRGVAAREEIGRLYHEADIFVNASWLDNMPVSIQEAFASGTPVVTTAPESIPYLVEHERTGLLSPIGDPHSLAANVIRLLREPQLALRLADNAHRQSRAYTWAQVHKRWLDLYDSLGRRAITAPFS